MTSMEKFAQRLRQLRAEKSAKDGITWTAEKVSKEIGVGQSGYSNYENAVRLPSLDKMILLANFFGESPAYIAGFVDNRGNSDGNSLLHMPKMTEQAKEISLDPTGDFGISNALLSHLKMNESRLLVDVVQDNAMAKDLQKGDMVFIDQEPVELERLTLDIYAIRNEQGKIWYRWIKPELNGQYRIYPNNTTHYDTYTCSNEEMKQYEIVGRIFKIIRSPQFHDLNV
ncbi:TPA: LexA family transcriptional regulator [Photobacterium damselae]